MSLRNTLIGAFALLCTAAWSFAQPAAATLTGAVVDGSGASVSGAVIAVVDESRALRRETISDSEGYFTLPQLPASTYSVQVQKTGFTPSTLSALVLNVNDRRSVRVTLEVSRREESLTVTSETVAVRESPSVGTVVTQNLIENQPLNGRSFQTLVELAPGVVITPSSLPTPGHFSVNGQRTSSNYFTIDGVSANFGSSASVTPYETIGGAVPSYSALGSTNSLVSVDAVQEFSIQTSTYAAEFGRQPGGQVSIVTRSGANQVHGSVFEYLRNDILDANNWFANANGLERRALRQNDFGFTAGGPVILPRIYNGRNRTFFFVSYEGLRLRQPFVTNPLQVPSLAARQQATGILRDLLNAFPLPTSPALASDPKVAPYLTSFSNPSELNATSGRLDQNFGTTFSLFGRYNYAPSENRERAKYCAASCVSVTSSKTETTTAGATWTPNAALVSDTRFNYSRSKTDLSYVMDTFGGAIVPPASSLYPSFTTGSNGYIYIEVDPSGDNTLSEGLFVDNRQRQSNVVQTFSWIKGGHNWKFGGDYRRLSPSTDSGNYRRSFLFDSVSQLTHGKAPSFTIIAPDIVLRPVYQNFSAFAQDTWRISNRLTLTYGLRYEVSPAPAESSGNDPVTVVEVDDRAKIGLAPAGESFYKTTWANFAPRAGLAMRLNESGSTVLRGGFGVFYDLGYNFTGTAFSTSQFPYARRLAASDVTFTSSEVSAQPPAVDRNPASYPRLFAYEQNYGLPYTLQYNFAIEQAAGQSNVVTLSYVGANGRRLSRVESLRSVTPRFSRVDLVRNDGASDYHAVQGQFQRRFSRGVQALVSYTFGKSLDTVSDESNSNLQAPVSRLAPEGDRGPSSFDLRHAFNGALSWQLPSPANDGFSRAVFGGWSLDTIVRARSATPVNVVTGRDVLGLGLATISRPDSVPGVPLYLEGDGIPGGRRFNPAAFDANTPRVQARQGTLGRNVLRGFDATQTDLSLKRSFDFSERWKLQLRAEGFNVFNHPGFFNPSGVITSARFGQAIQMLSSGLAGLSPLYQIGGPRSFQMAIKLLF